jgi:hypothetical protein
MTMIEINIPADADWYTEISHPVSGIAHQMVEIDGTLYGRVVQDGREIVSPSTDPDYTYRQYQGRVNRWIADDEETERLLGERETTAPAGPVETGYHR